MLPIYYPSQCLYIVVTLPLCVGIWCEEAFGSPHPTNPEERDDGLAHETALNQIRSGIRAKQGTATRLAAYRPTASVQVAESSSKLPSTVIRRSLNDFSTMSRTNGHTFVRSPHRLPVELDFEHRRVSTNRTNCLSPDGIVKYSQAAKRGLASFASYNMAGVVESFLQQKAHRVLRDVAKIPKI